MSSIRPLLTITALSLLVVLLYWQINKGPVRPIDASNDMAQNQTPEGVPPLSLSPQTGTSTGVSSSSPPSWGDSNSASQATEPPSLGPSSTMTLPPAESQTATRALPELPPIPELPPHVSQQPDMTAGAPAVNAMPQLPANIPTAQYDPSAASATSASYQTEPQPPMNGSIEMPSMTTSTPLYSNGQQQYAAGADELSAATPAVESPLTRAWPKIQSTLDSGELAKAHLLLSQWYGDPSLTPNESGMVDELLSQLAGTVVYSTEHRLEPAYTVQPGDTLETIAAQYDVPWQLLAKINGISAGSPLQPGQEIKVMRGPFMALIELDRGRLTLVLDGRYAGQFPISVEPTASASEGEWQVEQKLTAPGTSAIGMTSTGGLPSVGRVLVLEGGASGSAGTKLTIVSDASAPGANMPVSFRLSSSAAEELSDILSVGSRVIIRR